MGMARQAHWGDYLEAVAEAHHRYLVRVGRIKPKKSKQGGWTLVVVGNTSRRGGFNPVVTRTMNTVMRESGIQWGQKKRPNLQLYYNLAEWLLRQWRAGLQTPTRTLRLYQDDALLGILQQHGQIRADAVWWDSLTPSELDRLEKRLHHLWPSIVNIARAIDAPTRHATNSRRKPQTPMRQAVSLLIGARKT